MTNAAYKAWKLLEGDYTMFEHETIWLQPWCDKCAESGENRLWCQDDVWDQCDLCERKSVKYVIAPAPQPAPADDPYRYFDGASFKEDAVPQPAPDGFEMDMINTVTSAVLAEIYKTAGIKLEVGVARAVARAAIEAYEAAPQPAPDGYADGRNRE